MILSNKMRKKRNNLKKEKNKILIVYCLLFLKF